jgi:hypothetical protein
MNFCLSNFLSNNSSIWESDVKLKQFIPIVVKPFFKKVKRQFALQQAMKDRGEAQVQLYSFLSLGARGGWVVNAMPQPL